MSYVHASIPMDANKISKMMSTGLITNDASHQRASLDWNRDIKTNAISSGIMDIPFPPLYAKRERIDGKNYYRLVDGGHRSHTYRSYINNEWAASKCDPITYFNEVTGEYEVVDISFKLFSELPQAVKDKILNTSFQMIFFDNLTEEEEVELFRRLNSGKPLSAKEKTVANVKEIDKVLEIGRHPIFENMYSKTAVIKKSHVGVIMKTWCMLNMNIRDVSFETKDFADIARKTSITDNQAEELSCVFNYMLEVHQRMVGYGLGVPAKKIYTETHFVSLVPFIKKAIDSGIRASAMVEWLSDFYGNKNGASKSEKYNVSCKSGVAKNTNIISRHLALMESYNSFFRQGSES